MCALCPAPRHVVVGEQTRRGSTNTTNSGYGAATVGAEEDGLRKQPGGGIGGESGTARRSPVVKTVEGTADAASKSKAADGTTLVR